ncbi:MAG: hypothetical protein GF308_08730 [Candidatus Heimdallarchaeota archaeon]|nr:hypothetical protein [Candidatus Heimdallarchaeota archaeon]
MARLTIDVDESISKVWSFLNRLEKIARCFDFIKYGDRTPQKNTAHWFIRSEKINDFSSEVLIASIISKTDHGDTKPLEESSLSIKVSNKKIAFQITFHLKRLSFTRTEITVVLNNLNEEYLNKFNRAIDTQQFLRNLKKEIETGEIGYWDFFN